MPYSSLDFWFSWKGRINRQPYFFAGLIMVIVAALAGFISKNLSSLISLLFAYNGIVLAIKRAHDRGRSGWFVLLYFVPLLNLWPTVELTFFKGDAGENRFGPDPLGLP